MEDWSSYSDQELIDAVRQGHQQAFTLLIERHQRMVARTVMGMIGNGDDADDIGQEVFIRFYKSLDDFRGDSKVSTYLTRIAINLSLNEIKRQKRKGQLFRRNDEEGNPLEIKDVSNDAERIDMSETVNMALNQLDAKHRQVVVLRLVDGYSVKETADILRVPEGTILSRLARAQKKLKEILKPIIDRS